MIRGDYAYEVAYHYCSLYGGSLQGFPTKEKNTITSIRSLISTLSVSVP